MKDTVLIKDLPYLAIDVASGTFAQSQVNPIPGQPVLGSWDQKTPSGGDYFLYSSYIDIAGLTNQELTFFPVGGEVQRAALSMGPTEAFIEEWILATVTPIDFPDAFNDPAVTALNVWNHLPGQTGLATSFQNIMYGKTYTWTRNTSLLQNFAVKVQESNAGSGEATNGDRIYIYRLVQLVAPTSAGVAEIPSARLIIAGQLREEKEYEQIMRLRRSYELQQQPDRD